MSEKGIACLCSRWAKERGGKFHEEKKEFKSMSNGRILMFYVFMGNSSVNGRSYNALFSFRERVFFI